MSYARLRQPNEEHVREDYFDGNILKSKFPRGFDSFLLWRGGYDGARAWRMLDNSDSFYPVFLESLNVPPQVCWHFAIVVSH